MKAVEAALELKNVELVLQVLSYVENPSAFVLECDEV